MARKTGSTISQEELYPSSESVHPHTPVQGEMDEARMLDLDAEQESPFLRGQKRVSVRRGSLPKIAFTRLAWAAAACVVIFLCAASGSALYHYGERSWRFRVESSDDIEVTGLHNVTRGQVLEAMGSAIGRNIFFVSLAQSKAALEQIPWVASASVMRFVPNHLKVEIQERTPVAFARVGSKIMLADAEGALMELPRGKKYSFPVVLGMSSSEPHSTRLARMKIYNDLVSQLDSDGAHYSQGLSEVDLSDPDDVKIIPNSPQDEVTIHLGSSDYLERYQIYISHVQGWREKFSKLESVDLRYGGQIIVNPDSEAVPHTAPLSPRAVKAAMSAGVKQAALVHREVAHREVAHREVAHPMAASANSAGLKSSAPKSTAIADATTATANPKPAVKTKAASHPHSKWKAARAKPRRAAVAHVAKKTAPPPLVNASAASPKPQRASANAPQLTTGNFRNAKPSPAILKTQENP